MVAFGVGTQRVDCMIDNRESDEAISETISFSSTD
jgi:hypothetical protein